MLGGGYLGALWFFTGWLFFLLIFIGHYRNRASGESPKWFLLIFPTAICWSVIILQLISLSNRHELQALKPEEIVRIQIGNRTITDTVSTAAIVNSFAGMQDYTKAKGEKDPAITFVIELESGESYNYRIGYRKLGNREGVVIQYVSIDTHSHLNTGYAFCEELWAVLEGLELDLSKAEFISDR